MVTFPVACRRYLSSPFTRVCGMMALAPCSYGIGERLRRRRTTPWLGQQRRRGGQGCRRRVGAEVRSCSEMDNTHECRHDGRVL